VDKAVRELKAYFLRLSLQKNCTNEKENNKIKLKNLVLLVTLYILTIPLTSKAERVDFSLGGGYPFLLVPEASFRLGEGEKRLFINYKAGLDYGFSVGFEQAFGNGDENAVGVLVGAIGVRDDKRLCETDDFGSILGCALAEPFDDETTIGIGTSYSHNFSGINKEGWRVIKFEVGYGKGRYSNEKRIDGGIILSYQF